MQREDRNMERRQENIVRISVRNLVEFILRSGDIDNRRGAGREKEAMQAGSRLHRKIQKESGSAYRAEVSMKCQVPIEDMILQVEGRADGVIEEEDGITVDEIKGMYCDVLQFTEPIPVHKAQAMCYAYMIAVQREQAHVTVQMTYGNLDTYELKRFTETWAREDLVRWFEGLTAEYGKWALWQYRHRLERDASLKGLEFPFPYRAGQRDLAVSVYRTISRGKTLFIQAPTGIGKTMSAVFPAVKAMGEGYGDKLFYLTAKTVARTVAEEAVQILCDKGLSFFSVTITAKDKLCILDKPSCNPDDCPYARGHFDRVNDAVFDLLTKGGQIDRERILEQAGIWQVCPFELCLDLTTWADGVICDYNYVFDPNVYLKRFFAEGSAGEYLFLIDEAHNLVERAREMYSASLYKESFLEIRRMVKNHSRKLNRLLGKCNQILLEMKRECSENGQGGYQVIPHAGSFVMALQSLYTEMQDFAENSHVMDGNETWLEFYFDVRHFLNMHDRIDDKYRIYTELQEDGRFMIKELCINPSGNLRQCLDKGNSAVFFSATLLPMPYYRELLSGDPEDYAIYALSPFDRSRRLLAAARDVSSRYTRRGPAEYGKIYRYIAAMARIRTGNYLVFFPSYAFMKGVYESALSAGAEAEFDIRMQSSHMTEEQREEFLEAFRGQREGFPEKYAKLHGESPDQPLGRSLRKSLIGFCVMGGIFSEGIDLTGESLIGACIVGTGLPQVCHEREILKQYYEEQGRNGFDFAYRYPGMNKVLQAAGRVIRTAEDEGVIVLLDDRFLSEESRALFPREWSDCLVTDQRQFGQQLEQFWNRENRSDPAQDE